MKFRDRREAGKLLGEKLKDWQNAPQTIVLGIPRGGVVVADQVARLLNLPLDILVSKKIGAPKQKELAIGAVTVDGQVYWDSKLLAELHLNKDTLQSEVKKQTAEVERRVKVYLINRPPLLLEGQRVLLIDDGIATGSTVIAGVSYLKRQRVEEVVVGTPVISREAAALIGQTADQVIFLEQPSELYAIGQFYDQFPTVRDQEVLKILNSSGLS